MIIINFMKRIYENDMYDNSFDGFRNYYRL